MDLHHGNGVETAFYQTSAVFTYSIHKYESGFYPGTGGQESVGEGRGLGFSVNIPLKDGATDATLQQVELGFCFVTLFQLTGVGNILWKVSIVDFSLTLYHIIR